MKNWWLVVPVVACGAALGASCGGSTGNTVDSGIDVAVETGGGNDAAPEAAPACAAPEVMCGSLCTNVETDNANCGKCGTACPSGKVCSGGTCSLTCGSLTTCTSDGGAPYCANTETDNANCGACGTVCPSGKVCSNGTCSLTCGTLTTCTPDGGTPYCANTDSDNANCGACGSACPLGEACSGGKCQLPPGSNAAGCDGTSDPSWSDVIAYVSCNGTTITDASGKSTVTLYNTPTISSTPAGAPAGSSCSLGSAGSYATAKGFGVTLPSSLGTGDFTVELAVYQTAWFDPNDQSANILVSSSAYPPTAGNFPTFFSHTGTSHLQVVPGTTIPVFIDNGSALSTWELYAASRVSGVTYVFRQGTLLTSFADTTDYSDTVIYAGHQANGPYNAMMGSIGQIRVTKGAGRYTSSYTPCSGAFATK